MRIVSRKLILGIFFSSKFLGSMNASIILLLLSQLFYFETLNPAILYTALIISIFA